jgi:hypothetical protein
VYDPITGSSHVFNNEAEVRIWLEQRYYQYERYVNLQAAISHLQLFQNQFSHRFTQIAKRERFLVFGEPSDELKVMLHSYEATFLESIDRLIR